MHRGCRATEENDAKREQPLGNISNPVKAKEV
jgi:hypothetical protein